MADSTADVFVSYKAEDRARLKPLVKALEAEGFTVWWDAHIGGGTDWREEIQQHLDAARCVIVAWSERSVGAEGRFVRDEATRAQRVGSYVPVRIDPVEPPLGFGEVQATGVDRWRTGDPTMTTQAKTLTKAATVYKILSREKGATIHEMGNATGWQPHSCRGYCQSKCTSRKLRQIWLVGTFEKWRNSRIRRNKISSAKR